MSGYESGFRAAPVERPRVSGTAITGFVLGLLLCVPLVTGLGAILFSVLGMRATRRPLVRGRGLAIAGLILGILSTLLWCGVGAFVAFLISGSSAPRATLADFADKLGSGNVAAAQAECDATISTNDLDDLHTKLAPMGAYRGLTCFSVSLNDSASAGENCTLAGQAHFSTGEHPFTAVLIKDASGAWKVKGFHVY